MGIELTNPRSGGSARSKPGHGVMETASFERRFFDEKQPITRIGAGALGGKASGLVSILETIRREFPPHRFDNLTVGIPHLTVLTTELFDAFIRQNHLDEVDFDELSDDNISNLFQKASLPARLVGDIRALAEEIRVPIAVRSSGLLEDTMYRPFAGVYATKMIPNNQPSVDTRFQKMAEAIKFVYASMFFEDARRHIETVDSAGVHKEKMAVILQEIVGSRYGNRFYPNVSGVARSFNFYPHGHAKPEDGVVELALGLGKTVVDGGKTWSYSPAYPKSPPPFNDISDMMKNTQTEFWAVNMGRPPAHNPMKETEYLIHCGLPEAEEDDTLRHCASTYVSRADRVVPGTGTSGPRILNFSPLLVLQELPFNDLLREMIQAGESSLNEKVELEFALNFGARGKGSAQFGLLQVRPAVVPGGDVDLPLSRLSGPDVLVASENVLGNGVVNAIKDIVYVLPRGFDPKYSVEAAVEIEKINKSLTDRGRSYLLIGFGRIGTSDPWRGIPGGWHRFCGAKVIVEVQRKGMETAFSQGSHFFHNMTSREVAYFSVTSEGKFPIDWQWLERLETVAQGTYVRHVCTDWPLIVKVDGRCRRGVVLKHECQ